MPKPDADNSAVPQRDECIQEMPPFRENLSGGGFLLEERDQMQGFLKGTQLIIWGPSRSQREQAGRAQTAIGCCRQSSPA